MSPPVARVNTFFQKTTKPILEPVSKFFIIVSLILGVNRLTLISQINTIYNILATIYIFVKSVVIIYITVTQYDTLDVLIYLLVLDFIQYFGCVILGFAMHNRLLNYYLTLNKIDNKLGVNVRKFGIRDTLYNLLQLFITLLLFFVTNIHYSLNEVVSLRFLFVMLFKLLTCVETHYYGHLVSLMIPRLQAMCNYMTSTGTKLSKVSDEEEVDDEITKPQMNINKLMDLYNNLINAYDILNGAIKWQILMFLTVNFFVSLFLLYLEMAIILSGDTKRIYTLVVNVTMIMMQLCPLLVPCIFAGSIQKEVLKIKEFLASKLYENTLDKPSRRTARLLLALINTRNLSFSLFHMFDIDITLPIKFVGLLFTYLIILLQFDKIMSPNTQTPTNTSLT